MKLYIYIECSSSEYGCSNDRCEVHTSLEAAKERLMERFFEVTENYADDGYEGDDIGCVHEDGMSFTASKEASHECTSGSIEKIDLEKVLEKITWKGPGKVSGKY